MRIILVAGIAGLLAGCGAQMGGFGGGGTTAAPVQNPNIVAFALRTNHSVGQQRFNRSALTLRSHAQSCATFPNADRAQEEFLRRGGPERDPLNLDPDGDGFACTWSPEPFRRAARAAD
ncbi:MAG: hypothetical protein ACXIUV_04635 [Alkalilacustris sp.]